MFLVPSFSSLPRRPFFFQPWKEGAEAIFVVLSTQFASKNRGNNLDRHVEKGFRPRAKEKIILQAMVALIVSVV